MSSFSVGREFSRFTQANLQVPVEEFFRNFLTCLECLA